MILSRRILTSVSVSFNEASIVGATVTIDKMDVPSFVCSLIAIEAGVLSTVEFTSLRSNSYLTIRYNNNAQHNSTAVGYDSDFDHEAISCHLSLRSVSIKSLIKRMSKVLYLGYSQKDRVKTYAPGLTPFICLEIKDISL